MDIHKEILKARELRQAVKKQFAEDGYATVSLNFNIPGYPKSDKTIQKSYLNVHEELQNYLVAARIPLAFEKVRTQNDVAGDISFYPFQPKNNDLIPVKELLETFESEHFLGRLIDVDLFGLDQLPVSSGKKKFCFICGKPAIECMHEKRHSFEELRSHVFNLVDEFNDIVRKKYVCHRLSEFATQSILYEVSLPGKPGLVCPNSRGSHRDMNYLTFLDSISAIAPFFKEIAIMGYEWDGVVNQESLGRIRTVGLEMEQAMLQATKAVNTQKGIIFLMGFSLFTAAYVLQKRQAFDQEMFRNVLQSLNKGLVDKELNNGHNRDASHGEKCFNLYGPKYAGGIRKEAELGFPTVFDVSLPLMRELFPFGLNSNNQKEFNDRLLGVLIRVISVNNDTNILHRAGVEALKEIKRLAFLVDPKLERFVNRKPYVDLMTFCSERNISPGGSADLLAVTVFLYKVMGLFQ